MTHPASGNSTWQDYPNTSTPVTAARLEAMESVLDRLDAASGSGAFFRMDLATNYGNPAGTDILAGAGWTIVKDTHDGGQVASGAGNTFYTIPVPGRLWDVMLTAATASQGTSSGFSAKVLLNGTNVSNNAMTSAYSELLGSESYARAWKMSTPLAQGDVLRVATWSSIATTIVTTRFGQPTQLIVRDAGPA